MQTLAKSIAPLLGLFIALPVLALFVYFGYTPAEQSTFFSYEHILHYTQNTFVILLGATTIVLFLGTLCAYVIARFEFTGHTLFGLLFVLPLAYPAYLLGYTYVGFFEYKGVFASLINQPHVKLDILTPYGAMSILGMAMFPYVYILARVSFASISLSVVELASLYNLSSLKAFFKLYLPLAYPAIFAGTLLAMMELLSDYGTVSYFGIDTFSVGIFKHWFGYGSLLDAIKLSLILLIFVFVLLMWEGSVRKKFRFVSATNSSQKAPKIKLHGYTNVAIFCLCFCIASITFFIPTGVLCYWLVLDIHTLDWSALGYLWNTLILALSASGLIIVLAFIMLYCKRFYPTKLAQWTHKLSMLGYAIPGAIIGIGMLIVVQAFHAIGLSWVGGSMIVLLFAYLSRYFSASLGSVENGLSKIDTTIDDASLLFGKSTLYRLFRVYIPLMRPYLISGFLILYIDIAKELPATLLLRPFNYDTIAVRIYELASNEMLSKTALPSLLLLLTTSAAVFLLNFSSSKGKQR